MIFYMNYKVINNMWYFSWIIKLLIIYDILHEIQTLIQGQDNSRMENTFLNVVITVSIFNCVLLYINLACLSGCLFLYNKCQNGWTDQAQIMCGTSRGPMEGLWMNKF